MKPSETPSAPGDPATTPLGKHNCCPASPPMRLPLASAGPPTAGLKLTLPEQAEAAGCEIGFTSFENKSVLLDGLVMMNCCTSPPTAPSVETPETSLTTRFNLRSIE